MRKWFSAWTQILSKDKKYQKLSPEIRSALSGYGTWLTAFQPEAPSFGKLLTDFHVSAPADQLLMLPLVHLRWEKQCAAEKRQAPDVRQVLQRQFPILMGIPGFALCFEPTEMQEILLGQQFLAPLLDEIMEHSSPKLKVLKQLRDWLTQLPHPQTTCPPGFSREENCQVNVAALMDVSRRLSDLVSGTFGEAHTREIFQKHYGRMSKIYHLLETFPIVTSLMPPYCLQTDQVVILSKHQLTQALLKQVEQLELLNRQLEEKNEVLARTQRLLYEEQNRAGEVLEKLRQVNEGLNRYASEASHDLQEPLRTMRSYLDLIDKKLLPENTSPELTEYLGYVRDASGRLQLLIRKLLEYSRLGFSYLHVEPVELSTIIELVGQQLKASLHHTGGQLELQQSCTFPADRTQMIQLFQNLISNALVFAKPESTPFIKINCEQNASSIIIRVADNGIGMSNEVQAQVFQPFYRFHQQATSEGTGLGLSICRKIMERHNGQISVSSNPGEGTVFTLVFPLEENNA